jgi:hypothetical protein
MSIKSPRQRQKTMRIMDAMITALEKNDLFSIQC